MPNLFVSVVPFNVTVNYGRANTHFLAAPPPASAYPTSWSGSTGWGGCAEMRSISLLDANPQNASNGLRRYYWPSTYNVGEKYNPNLADNAQPFCLSGAASKDTRSGNPSGAHNVCMGHNDWRAPAYVLSGSSTSGGGDDDGGDDDDDGGSSGPSGSGGKQNSLMSAFSSNNLVTAAGLDPWATAHGPNMMCPPQRHRVLPLTRDRATIQARIDALASLPFSYGTNVAAGLQAGWFTLSPNWRTENGFAGWPSAEPPANPNDQRPALPKLPLNYFTESMSKVMIVLTDGDNLWLNSRDVQGNDPARLVRPESRRAEGFYGSYGYLGSDYAGDDRFTANSTSAASAKIDTEAEAWCQKIRARRPPAKAGDPPGPEQITIYTIGFGAGIGSRATTMLTNCASDVGGKRMYFPAPTDKDLRDIFRAIGDDLRRLRLRQ